MARLTGTHRQGAGDDGASMLLQGGRKISKGSPAAHLYGEIEWVQHCIAAVFAQSPEHTPIALLLGNKVTVFLSWVDHVFGCISGWVWTNGESTNHAIPVEAMEWLDRECEALAKDYGAAQDFETWGHPALLALNELRLSIRTCERWFATWWHSEAVMPLLLANPEMAEQYRLTAAFLNRLSYWVFLVTRQEAQRLKDAGVRLRVRTWAGKVPEFPFSANT